MCWEKRQQENIQNLTAFFWLCVSCWGCLRVTFQQYYTKYRLMKGGGQQVDKLVFEV